MPRRPLRHRCTGFLLLLVLSQASGGSKPEESPQTASSGKIAYVRQGQGQPVIVLQAGLGDDRSAWAGLMPRLARNGHTVFAYDRPGYGRSPAVPGTRDPCAIADELHGVLHEAGLAPPYVLVGHSIGGLYQYAFARRYPDEVAALVLLDPTHPAHWQRMQADSPALAATLKGLRATTFTPAMRQEFDAQSSCVEQLETLPALHMPVRLLTRSNYNPLERGAFEAGVHQLEADWQRLTGAERIEAVPRSGHYIQRDQPARALDAIESAIAEAEALKALPAPDAGTAR